MTKSTKRIAAEKGIYELMDTFDPSGYNSKMYKDLFSNMNELTFKKFMTKISNGEEFLSFEIDNLNHDELSLDKIFKGCRKLGIKYEQHIIYRENNTVSEYPVLTLFISIKRLQQMLSKKNSASGDIDTVNALTGTVTGESKSAGITDTQVFGLITTNQYNTVKELLGPRSDDEKSKIQMLTRIEEYGEISMKDLNIDNKNKQATNTMKVFLKSAGLEVKTV